MYPRCMEQFDEPRLAINRVYTRQGDAGETSLAGGQRLPKDAHRIALYGTVDELNSFVGLARATAADDIAMAALGDTLLRVQHELFNLGSELATLPADMHPRQARITDAEIHRLEEEMDRANESLPALRSFILPGNSRLNAALHICRTVCRRAERLAVTMSREEPVPPEALRYLNRLSDAFFVWSRWASHQSKTPETLWEPNRAAGGSGAPGGKLAE